MGRRSGGVATPFPEWGECPVGETTNLAGENKGVDERGRRMRRGETSSLLGAGGGVEMLADGESTFGLGLVAGVANSSGVVLSPFPHSMKSGLNEPEHEIIFSSSTA